VSARILVVDDVAANVKLLEARLSAEYFDVVTASNGAEALAIAARAECDIILLDVMMPDMDGFEVCRRLKSNSATHFIPVVMITALDSPADRVRGLDAGADDFLTKPVSDIVLIARVRSLTRLKMMTDELRMRAITSLEIGVQAPEREAVADTGKGGRVLLGRRPGVLLQAAGADAERRANGRRRVQSGGSAVPCRRGQLRFADRVPQPRKFRWPAAMQPGALAGADAAAAVWPSPMPTTIRGCCAGWRSVSTTI
jgi:DNA-binding response OmpR family regulator